MYVCGFTIILTSQLVLLLPNREEQFVEEKALLQLLKKEVDQIKQNTEAARNIILQSSLSELNLNSAMQYSKDIIRILLEIQDFSVASLKGSKIQIFSSVDKNFIEGVIKLPEQTKNPFRNLHEPP